MTDNQSSFGMTNGSQLYAKVGSVGNVYQHVFWYHTNSQKQNIKYSSIEAINEVNIVNSVNLYRFYRWYWRCGFWAYNGRPKPESLPERFQLLFSAFEDFDFIWLTRVFWRRYKEGDQYIAYGTIRGNMQQIHIRGRRMNEVVKTTEKILLNPVIEKDWRIYKQRGVC